MAGVEGFEHLIEEARRQKTVIVAVAVRKLAEVVAGPEELVAFGDDDPGAIMARCTVISNRHHERMSVSANSCPRNQTPRARQGLRRGLVPRAARQIARRSAEDRGDLRRGRAAVHERVRRHHRGAAQPALDRGAPDPATPPSDPALRRARRLGDHGRQGAGVPRAPRHGRAGRQPAPAAQGERRRAAAYKPPVRSTIHDEIVTLRQVLKAAVRDGWLGHLPDLSAPYRTRGRNGH
jgi:hypothetical protein